MHGVQKDFFPAPFLPSLPRLPSSAESSNAVFMAMDGIGRKPKAGMKGRLILVRQHPGLPSLQRRWSHAYIEIGVYDGEKKTSH